MVLRGDEDEVAVGCRGPWATPWAAGCDGGMRGLLAVMAHAWCAIYIAAIAHLPVVSGLVLLPIYNLQATGDQALPDFQLPVFVRQARQALSTSRANR